MRDLIKAEYKNQESQVQKTKMDKRQSSNEKQLDKVQIKTNAKLKVQKHIPWGDWIQVGTWTDSGKQMHEVNADRDNDWIRSAGKTQTKNTDTNDKTRIRWGEREGRRPGEVMRGRSIEERTWREQNYRQRETEGKTKETLKVHVKQKLFFVILSHHRNMQHWPLSQIWKIKLPSI